MACLCQIGGVMLPIFMCHWTIPGKVEKKLWLHSCDVGWTSGVWGSRLIYLVHGGMCLSQIRSGMLAIFMFCARQCGGGTLTIFTWALGRCYGLNAKQHSCMVTQVFMPYVLELWVYVFTHKLHMIKQEVICSVLNKQYLSGLASSLLQCVSGLTKWEHTTLGDQETCHPRRISCSKITSKAILRVNCYRCPTNTLQRRQMKEARMSKCKSAKLDKLFCSCLNIMCTREGIAVDEKVVTVL